MTNRRITLIAARWSQHAWFSSRWVLSGVASPTCSAMVQPLRLPRFDRHAWLSPAWIHGSTAGRPLGTAGDELTEQVTRPAGLYHEVSSRLWFCSRHTDRIMRRLRPVRPFHNKITSTGRPHRPSSQHEMRLPY